MRLDNYVGNPESRLGLLLVLRFSQNVPEYFAISYQGRVSFIQLQGAAEKWKMTQYVKSNASPEKFSAKFCTLV